MKRITALAFLTAALISMASAYAHAQATGFKVPFDFTVGNQVFPAGTYQVGCALIIGKRNAQTDLKTSLNDVLREFEIGS